MYALSHLPGWHREFVATPYGNAEITFFSKSMWMATTHAKHPFSVDGVPVSLTVHAREPDATTGGRRTSDGFVVTWFVLKSEDGAPLRPGLTPYICAEVCREVRRFLRELPDALHEAESGRIAHERAEVAAEANQLADKLAELNERLCQLDGERLEHAMAALDHEWVQSLY